VPQAAKAEVRPVPPAVARLVGRAAQAVVRAPQAARRERHLRRVAFEWPPEVSKERRWAASVARSQVSIQVLPPARG